MWPSPLSALGILYLAKHTLCTWNKNPPTSSLTAPESIILLFVSKVLRVSEITKYLSFCDWLIYLTIISSCFVHNSARFTSCWRVNNTPSCGYTSSCLSFHPSVNTWMASTFRLLWEMRLWMWFYRYLCKILLSIPFSIDPVEILDRTVILLLICWGAIILIST